MKSVTSTLSLSLALVISSHTLAANIRGEVDMNGIFYGTAFIDGVSDKTIGFHEGENITVTHPLNTHLEDAWGAMQLIRHQETQYPGFTVTPCTVRELNSGYNYVNLSLNVIYEEYTHVKGPVIVGQGQLYALSPYVNSKSSGWLCNPDPVTGDIVGRCGPLGEHGVQDARGIVVNTNQNRAYITDRKNNTVSLCSLNPQNGSIDSCQKTGDSFHQPWGIALDPKGEHAYVLNTGTRVRFCRVNAGTGLLDSCGFTAYQSQGRGGITFNSSGSRAYVTSAESNELFMYEVDSNTGELINGVSVLPNLKKPLSVALTSDDQALYVTQDSDQPVLRCEIDHDDGSLHQCDTALTGKGAWVIALNAYNTLAFVADYYGAAHVCEIDPDSGLFIKGCTQTSLRPAAMASTL